MTFLKALPETKTNSELRLFNWKTLLFTSGYIDPILSPDEKQMTYILM